MITDSKKKVTVLYAIMLVVLIAGLIALSIYNNRLSKQLASTQEDLKLKTDVCIKLNGELEVANDVVEAMKDDEYIVGTTVTNKEIEMLAKTVWGEARGCSRLQQSAVVWCILNRVDAGRGTIAEVITAPGQFYGYSKSFPVTDEIRELVEDVVARWKLEKVLCGDVGRTLPKEYLYFHADSTGIGNVFRNKYNGDYTKWNWDCWNPYS